MPEAGLAYPAEAAAQSSWVLARRGARRRVSPDQPHGVFVELERDSTGKLTETLTVLLTNKECPFRCVMCDLWENTLQERVPVGSISAQMEVALQARGNATVIKLYNSGSFFDPQAIPHEEYPSISARLRGFSHVIVESHPAFIGARTLEFARSLTGALEVAIGLETAHPVALEKLNKRFSLEQFTASAAFLRAHNIALRVFLLLNAPFIPASETQAWTLRSIDFALEQGASAVVVIPTRFNRSLEDLEKLGLTTRSRLQHLEDALAYGIAQRRGRVFADLWDLNSPAGCARCFPARKERLRLMNNLQTVAPKIHCTECEAPL
ncbi:MAG TPA: radical SAM protein [Methylomirabilota bacterium]|nr:radical SAM protein [Methylomirabilota bacterium]